MYLIEEGMLFSYIRKLNISYDSELVNVQIFLKWIVWKMKGFVILVVIREVVWDSRVQWDRLWSALGVEKLGIHYDCDIFD